MSKPMQVVFHVGAHVTDDERLYHSLGQNAEMLRKLGVELCDNPINEPILNEALSALKGGVASAEMEEIVLDALLEEDSTKRLIMSRTTFLGMPRRVFKNDGLMGYTGAKMMELAHVLPSAEPEFFMALKNPATMIAQMIGRTSRTYQQLMGSTDPLSKRWLPTMEYAVHALRGRRLVVWRNEDMPLIYPEVLRALAGVDEKTHLRGEDRLLRDLMTQDGIRLYRQRVNHSTPVAERRQIVEELLAEFANPEQLSLPIDFPDWTADLIEEITNIYHHDVEAIAAMPEVEFISV